MAAAYVRSASATSGSTQTTTIAATLGATVGSGNMVVGVVGFGCPVGTEVLSTVTDDKSNSYTIVRTVEPALEFAKASSFYLKNITNAPQTITATFSANCNFRYILFHEASGCDTTAPLDKEDAIFQTSINTDVDIITSPSVTTTTAGQYIFGAACGTNDNQALSIYSAGTNYTRREEVGSVTEGNGASEDRVQTSAGSIAATWTAPGASQHTIVFILTFKAAGAGGGRTTLPPYRGENLGLLLGQGYNLVNG